MHAIALVVLSVLPFPAAVHAAADGQLVVVLVRHAEKAATPGDDPDLSPAGKIRSEALAEVLADAGVDAIITTQYRRTQQTAAPLASARGVIAQVVRAGGPAAEHAREVAAAVRALTTGSLVVVVGHSNTVPAIIGALGGPGMSDLCETEYASLFTLVLAGDRPARLVHSRFGTPDPPAQADCSRKMHQK
jgi:phosphohistidine phosphatase SixA